MRLSEQPSTLQFVFMTKVVLMALTLRFRDPSCEQVTEQSRRIANSKTQKRELGLHCFRGLARCYEHAGLATWFVQSLLLERLLLEHLHLERQEATP
jgi:predicted protein tyrosine phosphatase